MTVHIVFKYDPDRFIHRIAAVFLDEQAAVDYVREHYDITGWTHYYHYESHEVNDA